MSTATRRPPYLRLVEAGESPPKTDREAALEAAERLADFLEAELSVIPVGHATHERYRVQVDRLRSIGSWAS